LARECGHRQADVDEHPARPGTRAPVCQQRPRVDELRPGAGSPGAQRNLRAQGRVRGLRSRSVLPAGLLVRGGVHRQVSRSRTRTMLLGAVVVASSVVLTVAVLPRSAPQPKPILVGAVFPLDGSAGSLPEQEALGVRIAAELVNADGGVGGRPIALDVRTLERAKDAPAVMAELRNEGAQVVIGAYSS